jgi:hypothetical protein
LVILNFGLPPQSKAKPCFELPSTIDSLPNLEPAAMLSAPNFFWREGPLAEIKNANDFKAWQQGKPREVLVAFSARAALRVLPLVQEALHDNSDTVLQVFGSLAFTWAGAKYSAAATKGYSTSSGAIEAGHSVPVSSTASDAAFAAHTASRTVDAASVRDDASAYAAVAVASAANAISLSPAAFWSAVSIDARRVEKGVVAPVIAASPLWPQPQGQPVWLQSLWQQMKEALRAELQGWDVWIEWYDERLAGRFREEEHELAYVRIDTNLWYQGPGIVNAAIKRRIEELEGHEPPPSGWQSSFDQPSRRFLPPRSRMVVPG